MVLPTSSNTDLSLLCEVTKKYEVVDSWSHPETSAEKVAAMYNIQQINELFAIFKVVALDIFKFVLFTSLKETNLPQEIVRCN